MCASQYPEPMNMLCDGGKGDFADGSKVTDPHIGQASGFFRWTQFNPMKPLKAKNFLWLETGEMRQEGRSERFKE